MKNILITGGAGFIGSNFVRHMINTYKDYKIINLDLLTYAGRIENLDDIKDNQNYTFIKGDICDEKLISEIFENHNINIVINFAAESHVDRSIENPQIFLQTNILGTQNLLEIAKKNWKVNPANNHCREYKPGVKFFQVSTDEVYGTLGKEGLFTETTPLAPNSPYSASKASADMMVRAYYETYGLPMNITRCSNNYGPFQFCEKLIPLIIKNCYNEKKLPVYGDGMQIRDWLHVEDHCIGIDLVLHKGKTGEVYNIGGVNEKANINIVKLIIKELGKKEILIEHVADRPGHDRRYAIDNTKIKTELGFEPKYTFEEGIKATIDWYLNNKGWIIEETEVPVKEVEETKATEISNTNRKIFIHISGGTTAQLVLCYMGYYIAKETDRELVMDISSFSNSYHFPYALGFFDIKFKSVDYIWDSYFPLEEKCVTKQFIKDYNPTFINNSRFTFKETVQACRDNDDKEVIYLVGDETAFGGDLKYFEEFKQMLTPKRKLFFLDKFKEKIKGKTSIGLYARRGEYIGLGWSTGYEYFTSGMNYINDKYKDVEYYIFSDDLEDVKANLGNKENFHYIKLIGGADAHIEALFCLASCTHTLVGPTTWAYYISILNQSQNSEHVRYIKDKNEEIPKFNSFVPTDTMFDDNDIVKYKDIVTTPKESTKQDNTDEIINNITQLLSKELIEEALDLIVELSFDSFYVTTEQRNKLTSLFELICVFKNEFSRAEQSLIEHLYIAQNSEELNLNLAMVKQEKQKELQSIIYASKLLKINPNQTTFDGLFKMYENTKVEEKFIKLANMKKMHFIFLSLTNFSFFKDNTDDLAIWLNRMGHDVSFINTNDSTIDSSKYNLKQILSAFIEHKTNAPFKSDKHIPLYLNLIDPKINKTFTNQFLEILANTSKEPLIFVNRSLKNNIVAPKNIPSIYWDFSYNKDTTTQIIHENNLYTKDFDKIMCQTRNAVVTTDSTKVDFYKQLLGNDNVLNAKEYLYEGYKINKEDELIEFEEPLRHCDEFLNFAIDFADFADKLTNN